MAFYHKGSGVAVIAAFVLASWFVSFSLGWAQNKPDDAGQRGLLRIIRDKDAKELVFYKESHALLVGVSRYTAGWPNLESVSAEMEQLAVALKKQGFQVEKVMDPDGDQLEEAFEDFIDRYGYDSDNRLLFFYSGHGYSMNDGQKGYLVPTDAPDPRSDRKGFLRKSLDMTLILAWSREMLAKHALFLFDSCFSGTIFKTKALPEIPPHISEITSRPVRQYITAGGAGQKVPAKSVFTPLFIRGLRGEADLDGDGYITGTELGLHLHKSVLYYQTGQTPQYGKIRDPDLDEGDFVFVAGGCAIIEDKKEDAVIEPKGGLRVETEPAGASVFINGEFRGRSPLVLEGLKLGLLEVKVEKEGYNEARNTIWVRAGQEIKVMLLLEEERINGTVKVKSEPSGARWYLDNNYVGFTPGQQSNVKEGNCQVKVLLDGYEEWTGSFQIRPHKVLQVFARLKASSYKTVQPGGVRRLTVETIPQGGQITILNATTPYETGMPLKPGRYLIEATKYGYEKVQEWITISDYDQKVLINLNMGMTFVLIPEGNFMMGSEPSANELFNKYGGKVEWYTNEHPQHEVVITRPFYMLTTEVTVGQWRKFAQATGYKTDAEKEGSCFCRKLNEGVEDWIKGRNWSEPGYIQSEKHPVVCVSWNDAQKFIKWLNQKEGTNKYRLPTEAEWEYAARGGTTTSFFWGDNPSDACEYENVADKTKFHEIEFSPEFRFNCTDDYYFPGPVGSLKPNQYGLYDMMGNVVEPCEDIYSPEAYRRHRRNDPVYKGNGSGRVLRGGSWLRVPRACRSAFRNGHGVECRHDDAGFRLARTY